MTIEENKKLIERYPFLLPRNVWNDEVDKDYDYSWILGIDELPKGWIKLFLQMCEDIRKPLIENNYLDKFRFSEIKEKYGSMRLYNFGATQEINEIIEKYEYISQFVCEECGKPAEKESINGWVGYYCSDCAASSKYCSEEDYRDITFEPILHIYCIEKNCKYDKYIDCSDIWRRLYE